LRPATLIEQPRFQSLLSWISLWDDCSGPGTSARPCPGFNPCCPGSPSGTALSPELLSLAALVAASRKPFPTPSHPRKRLAALLPALSAQAARHATTFRHFLSRQLPQRMQIFR